MLTAFVFNFHFAVMEKAFRGRIQLLYSDTDSLVYEIFSEDLYLELAAMNGKFDFSNYPDTSSLYSPDFKHVTLKFKDELEGYVMMELFLLTICRCRRTGET